MTNPAKLFLSAAWRSGGGLAVAAVLVTGAAEAAEGRLVVALDPPTVETNRFWETDGLTGLNPSHQMLIGNDPESGAYEPSSVAASSSSRSVS